MRQLINDGQDFLNEVLDKKHLHLISIFPNKDINYLRKKAEQLGENDDEKEKTSAWIEEELNDSKDLEVANSRYETLRAFFPDKDESFLSEKCNDFSFCLSTSRMLKTKL